MVYTILEEMELEEGVLAKCLDMARTSQEEWRNWFKANRGKVERNQVVINKLKAGGSRAHLKTAQAKKQFMHTAPFLLRAPERLKETLSDAQYAKFLVNLEKLKKEIHRPNSPPRAKRGR